MTRNHRASGNVKLETPPVLGGKRMKQIVTFAVGLLAGFALGAGAIERLHAQAGKKPAYQIAVVEVTDPAAFEAYRKKAVETLKLYNGRFLALGKPDVKEGAPVQGNVGIIEFPSMADAEKWYSEPPYHPLIAERQNAAKVRLYFVEGVPQ
jgi:uncharacterized protein (DUF1330 family)